ncbi:aminopeptidase PepB [Gilliamella sp. Pra-s65]|uniref:aminopeptidase PepB n=1 Tax=unclassified Gilliamella TaxID=2685620 RepID=UPI0013657882|nr:MULTISPECIES: aminopeptidase PepB [unclassified Gilliamella]MWN90854.1 aminopeptidase PepB [Gilliamella sp. Pra-s65]MWP47350.1 aminopeptidase PepB [Gilliamella sp. Pas-s27]MWP73793.1 aminopeptidase PepB [Gilliamella sp. Pra-s52]
MSTLSILLSDKPAPTQWGKNALLSFSDDAITIHYDTQHRLGAIQRAGRKLDNQGISAVKLSGDNWDLEACWHFWLGYRNAKNSTKVSWPKLNTQDKQELKHRLAIIDWCRDIVNEQAETLSPLALATKSAELISAYSSGVSYNIISGEALKEHDYMGIYSVGKGSDRPAALLELDYNPSKNPNAPIVACLVGKGITFDSGGYSLKPSNFMESMRSDMGGAALVTSALALAIARGVNHRIKLYLCCADNLVSGNAFKLGDIIRYRNGKTVEVDNTDAEGRLVLADGLICADNDKPHYIIDCATLTGAAKIAVGNDYHSLLSFDDNFANQLLASSDVEHEAFWRLPLAEFHRSQFPSSFADMANSGIPNTAGASTAAAFLSHFVKNYQNNWLHIDCSATFRKSATALWATGATGIGVRTLANLLIALK